MRADYMAVYIYSRYYYGFGPIGEINNLEVTVKPILS